jgi:hypothetical protein
MISLTYMTLPSGVAAGNIGEILNKDKNKEAWPKA